MKFIIDSKTPRIRQLIKHYNLLSAKLDSISIEHYQNGMQNYFEKTVVAISGEMSVVANEIFGITGTEEAEQVPIEDTDAGDLATPKRKPKKKQPIKLVFQDNDSMHKWMDFYKGHSWGSGGLNNTLCEVEYEGITEAMAKDAIDNFGAINCQ